MSASAGALGSAPVVASASLASRNVAALEQGLVAFRALGAARYALVRPELGPSGIGGHFRHIHDYYRCFVGGLASGRVDYDARERDARFERDLAHAAAEVATTNARLARIAPTDGDLDLLVRMDEPGAPSDDAGWSRSTLRRELGFLLSHTIHHFALIRVLLAADGIACAPDFGVAPSTLDHWQRNDACAPSPGSGT